MDRPKKKIHSEPSYLEMKVDILLLHLSRLFFLCTCKCVFNFLRDHSFVLGRLFLSLFLIHLPHGCLLRVSRCRDGTQGHRPRRGRAAPGGGCVGHTSWLMAARRSVTGSGRHPSWWNHPVFSLPWDWFFIVRNSAAMMMFLGSIQRRGILRPRLYFSLLNLF